MEGHSFVVLGSVGHSIVDFGTAAVGVGGLANPGVYPLTQVVGAFGGLHGRAEARYRRGGHGAAASGRGVGHEPISHGPRPSGGP